LASDSRPGAGTGDWRVAGASPGRIRGPVMPGAKQTFVASKLAASVPVGDNSTERTSNKGMATPNPPGTTNPTFESKHLHVRPEGVGPAEFRFTFEMQEKRIGNALGLSIGSHAAIFLLIFLIARMLPEKVYESVLPDRLPDIIWIAQPGPGGGGGG